MNRFFMIFYSLPAQISPHRSFNERGIRSIVGREYHERKRSLLQYFGNACVALAPVCTQVAFIVKLYDNKRNEIGRYDNEIDLSEKLVAV